MIYKKTKLLVILLTTALLMLQFNFAFSQDVSQQTQLSNFETTMVLSLLFPGVGQLYNKQILKGAVFAGSTILSLTLSIIMYSTANQIYEEYKKTGDPYHPKYDDYVSYINLTNVFLGITAGIWAVNLVDAYFVGHKSQKLGLEIKMNSSREISLAYKIKF